MIGDSVWYAGAADNSTSTTSMDNDDVVTGSWLNDTLARSNDDPGLFAAGNGSFNDSDDTICQLHLDNNSYMYIVSFSVIFCLSVVGNSLVIVTIAQNRAMRTVTNTYLQSLAISDLLLSVICMPPTLTALLFHCFLWGPSLCKLFAYLQPVSVTASAYTLVAIALERYNAICRPLQSRHWKTRSHAIKMIILVWVISLIICSPSLLLYKLERLDSGQYNCRVRNKTTNVIHISVTLNLVILIPLVLMIGLYVAIAFSLWRGIRTDSTLVNGELSSPSEDSPSTRSWSSSVYRRVTSSKPAAVLRQFGQSVMWRTSGRRRRSRARDELEVSVRKRVVAADGESAQRKCSNVSRSRSTNENGGTGQKGPFLRSTHTERNLETKKRVIIMLLVIVVEFVICWTPLYVYTTLVHSESVDFNFKIYPVLTILSYMSSCTNPMTYCFLNHKFRKAFLLAFGCRFMVKDAPGWYGTSLFRYQQYQRTLRQQTFRSELPSDEPRQPTKAIDHLVVRCERPVESLLPLVQLPSPAVLSNGLRNSRHDDQLSSPDDSDSLPILGDVQRQSHQSSQVVQQHQSLTGRNEQSDKQGQRRQSLSSSETEQLQQQQQQQSQPLVQQQPLSQQQQQQLTLMDPSLQQPVQQQDLSAPHAAQRPASPRHALANVERCSARLTCL